jgi:hypothetical protein
VGEKRVVDRGIDPQRVGDLQLFRPVDLLHRPVERIGRIDGEAAERFEHTDGRPGFEHRAAERLAFMPRRRRKLDRSPADSQVMGPDRLEFSGHDPLEPLERPRGEPGGFVGQRSGQRTRRRGNVWKNVGAHACERLYPQDSPVTIAHVRGRATVPIATTVTGFG